MRELKIAFGSCRNAKKWSNKTIAWDALLERLKTTVRTPESVSEYSRMPREERAQIKDKGGFVGGHLRDGRRKIDHVVCRSMTSLDLDQPDVSFLERYRAEHSYESIVYSTHSHTPERPRLRLIIPFTRDVTGDEYEAISRYLAQGIGIEAVDECSYRTNQLMYWPTTPADGEYICEHFQGNWLDPDAFLAAHPEWRDISQLPTSSRESAVVRKSAKRQQDPLQKKGIIGAYNNVYFPIQMLLEGELSDVYEPTTVEGRYTHIGSTTAAGAVVYEDRFLYSHHATDPASGRLLNAFDLMRVHRFGDLDEKESMEKALAYASGIPEVRAWLAEQHRAKMREEFASAIAEEDDDWQNKLEYNPKTGALLPTLLNGILIMMHDPVMKNIVFNELADGPEVVGELPWKHPGHFWRDADDAQLEAYINLKYGAIPKSVLGTAFTKVTDDRSYHPIKDMLAALPPWDGIPRLDTLYIDYLGADDTAYIRAVTRKPFVAAVRRVKQPGIKFDYMVVLQGNQGIGKSTVIGMMGGRFFSDSLSLSDMNDKTAAEKLQGYWIHEIGELAGMKKADIDKVKAFVSRQDDHYRASYGHRVTPHPRQCVFFGTTNSEKGFLRDITGNRRFWVVKVPGHGKYSPWEISKDTIDQLWAEAQVYEEAGEPLYLEPELETIAASQQREAMEQDDREGMVRKYLDTPLPDDWEDMSLGERRGFLNDDDSLVSTRAQHPGASERQTVCNMEIWCECFGMQPERIQPKDSYAIAAIIARIEEWSKPDGYRRMKLYGKQRVYRRKPKQL